MTNYLKTTAHNLTNFGFIKSKLPNKLYNDLLKECLKAEKNKEMISGLTSKGVPKHYYVEKNHDQLIEFVKLMHEAYEKSFPGISDIKVLTKNLPFKCTKPWINLQRENEFVPYHEHDGILSYSIWIKIPYDSSNEKFSGNFTFVYSNVLGRVRNYNIYLNKEEEGTIIMFPAKLGHIVWPFYEEKKNRISISGNIVLDSDKY